MTVQRPPIEQQVSFFFARDLAATAKFYEQVLELPLVLDQGSCRIYRVSEDSFLGFCERAEAPENPQGMIITFATRAVDQWYQFLQSKGVVFEKAPAKNPTYNIYHCFLRDPNGYLLEIQEFLDPAWPQKKSG